MVRRLGILIIILMVIQVYQALNVYADSNVIKTFFYAPAVSGKGEGSLIKVDIEIKAPGSGVFNVEAGGEVDPTTYHSMKMAYMAAMLYAGVDWRSVDVLIKLETQGNVAGPSGSLGVAVAIYTALGHGGYYTNNTVITGAISPDGTASRVGSVDVKCKTAINAGYSFYYPLVNLTRRLHDTCKGHPVSSLINASLTITGGVEPVVVVNTPLPVKFNDAMREATYNLSKRVKELLKYMPHDARSMVLERLNQSARLLDESPYTAASLAFTALTLAYRAYYQSILLNKTNIYDSILGEASTIENILNNLESRLRGMDASGSILYIEFLSTAYTRLADARASLREVEGLAEARSPLINDMVAGLALSRARVETVRNWISTAIMVRDVGPQVSRPMLMKAANLYGNYTGEAVEYANSILEYMVQHYKAPKEVFESRISAINNLMDAAKDYYNRGNYIAALGFYREALSRTISQIFGFFLTKGGKTVINGYYKDLVSIYAVIQSQLLLRGFVSGLAIAYNEYSKKLFGNEPATAIGLMEQAIATSLAWYVITLKPLASMGTTNTSIPNEPPLRDPALTITIAIASYILGLLAVSGYTVRISRSMIK